MPFSGKQVKRADDRESAIPPCVKCGLRPQLHRYSMKYLYCEPCNREYTDAQFLRDISDHGCE